MQFVPWILWIINHANCVLIRTCHSVSFLALGEASRATRGNDLGFLGFPSHHFCLIGFDYENNMHEI